jgi:hypothetical protein
LALARPNLQELPRVVLLRRHSSQERLVEQNCWLELELELGLQLELDRSLELTVRPHQDCC